MLTDALPYALPLVAGLLGLLFASAVDRWADRFDAWVDSATAQSRDFRRTQAK